MSNEVENPIKTTSTLSNNQLIHCVTYVNSFTAMLCTVILPAGPPIFPQELDFKHITLQTQTEHM